MQSTARPALVPWHGATRARVPLGRNSPSFLMAPWLECGAVEHGGVRLPIARFRSHSQRWRASISIVRHVVPGRLRSGGVALRARACPLVEIAHLFSWRLGSNVERWSMAGCGFPERDFAHIRSDGAWIYLSCALHLLSWFNVVVWRYARAHAPWSKYVAPSISFCRVRVEAVGAACVW